MYITIHIPVGDFLPDLATVGLHFLCTATTRIGDHVVTDMVTDMDIEEVTIMDIIMVTEPDMPVELIIRETFMHNVRQELEKRQTVVAEYQQCR